MSNQKHITSKLVLSPLHQKKCTYERVTTYQLK